MTALTTAAHAFADHYHANSKLVYEQSGWDLTLVLVATDTDERVTLRIENGRVAGISDGGESGGVVVSADFDTLLDVLELRRSPNEPYIFGELTVQGPQADFIRLDYITTTICPD